MSSGTPSAASVRRALKQARRHAGKAARRLGVYDRLAKAGLTKGLTKGLTNARAKDDGLGGKGVRGLVEVATPEEIVGWVEAPVGSPATRVTLHLNGLEIAATNAMEPATLNAWGEIRSFRFKLKDVWLYARTTHKLVVRAGGVALPVYQQGGFIRPAQNGTRSFNTLSAKMAEGHVFSATGRFQLSKKLDVAWQGEVLGLYDEVRGILAEAYGYDAFVMYGSLLGAVREGGFIGHDFDFDAGFISRHTDPRAAAEEMKQIAFTLIDRGVDVECMRSALHLHDGKRAQTRIDLFHLYFDTDGVLQFPFGAAGTTRVLKADWKGVQKVPFAGREVFAPVNAEQLVETVYGTNWREPQPGFNWTRDRKVRSVPALIPHATIEEVYWANFYARTEYTSGSTFFDFVNARPDVPGSVIDIGCGDGRDAFAFGVSGRRVLGLDRSHIGVRHATKKAETMGFPDLVRFQACDVGDEAALRAVLTEELANAPEGPVLFYARFFLHSITEDIQETLMGVVRDCARPGDMFAAEFRTDKDEKNMKVHTKHYRRFQNGPAFGVRLHEDYGFDVIFEQEGTGLSPYKGEDPELYRVLARHP
jgi:ubiquinone/menaquinone biosynthesis C-methylase UbiE